MTDLRNKVEEDHGLLKKIQLGIPGFRGYQQKEDLRIADSLLRMQIADLLKSDVLGTLELIRERAGTAMEIDLMNDIATVVSAAKTAPRAVSAMRNRGTRGFLRRTALQMSSSTRCTSLMSPLLTASRVSVISAVQRLSQRILVTSGW